MLISCQSYFFSAAASQGQMNERGSARAPRHRLLHYVVRVKPLALCHRHCFSVSGCTQRWPSGFSSDQNSLSSLSSPSAAAAAPDPAANYSPPLVFGGRDFPSCCINLCEAKARRLRVQTKTARKLGET